MLKKILLRTPNKALSIKIHPLLGFLSLKKASLQASESDGVSEVALGTQEWGLEIL